MTKQKKVLKKELAELERYIKYFWHNEFTMEMYGMNDTKDVSMKDYNNAIEKRDKLKEQIKNHYHVDSG